MSEFVIKNKVLIHYGGEDKDVVIPDGVTTIGKYAFTGQGITSVILPDSVKVIEERAFYECVRLSKVVMSKCAKFIGPRAFGYCRALKDIAIPDRIMEIGPDAFIGGDSLVEKE